MKYLISFFLVFFTVFTFGQSSIETRTDTLDVKKSNTIVSKQKTDTINKISDTLDLNCKKRKCSLKVQMVKEESPIEFLKYLLPIFTLLLGIAINKTLDYWSDKKKIKKAGKRWIGEIRCLETPMKTQIEVLEAFLITHSKETFETPKLAIYSILNCEIFKSLDKGELLKYIKFNKKSDYKEIVKASNTIHGYINIITNLYETLKVVFENYKSDASNYVNSMNNNLQLLLREFADYGVLLEKELGTDPVNDSRLRPILDLISKHIQPKRQTGDYNVFELENVFFIPLLSILSHLRLDERTRNLSVYTSNCLNDIKGIRMEKKYLTDNMTYIIDSYKKQLKDIENIINIIESK